MRVPSLRSVIRRVALFFGVVSSLVLVQALPVQADERPERPNYALAATHLLPGLQVFHGDVAPTWGLRWELTPVSFAFGLSSEESRWRAFFVEPRARMAGSVELFGTVEYADVANAPRDGWLFRAGARVYAPIRGGAVSLGAAYLDGLGRRSVSYELGAHVLSGAVGAFFSFTAHELDPLYTWTLRFRYL